jgi:hypothetical protein
VRLRSPQAVAASRSFHLQSKRHRSHLRPETIRPLATTRTDLSRSLGGLARGIALSHATAPSIVYVVEDHESEIPWTGVLTSARYDATNKTVMDEQPTHVLYVKGRELRRISLAASGSKPTSELVYASPLGEFCTDRFELGNEFINGVATRLHVVMANSAGAGCEARSVSVEVTNPAGAAPEFSAMVTKDDAEAARFYMRNSNSGAIEGTAVVFAEDGAFALRWIPVSGSDVMLSTRMESEPKVRAVVADFALFETAARYYRLNIQTGTPTLEDIGAVIKGIWIGTDGNTMYLYDFNYSYPLPSVWYLWAVNFAEGTVIRRYTGAGQVLATSMAADRLFISIRQDLPDYQTLGWILKKGTSGLVGFNGLGPKLQYVRGTALGGGTVYIRRQDVFMPFVESYFADFDGVDRLPAEQRTNYAVVAEPLAARHSIYDAQASESVIVSLSDSTSIDQAGADVIHFTQQQVIKLGTLPNVGNGRRVLFAGGRRFGAFQMFSYSVLSEAGALIDGAVCTADAMYPGSLLPGVP